MTTEQINKLTRAIKTQLEQDWIRIRGQPHSTGSKGRSYEDAFAELLNQYFSGNLKITSRTAVIDRDLSVFEVFDTAKGEHEFDVMALYQNASPLMVFSVGEMSYAPLDAMAFVCEVKSKVDKGRLERDLRKLSKLRELSQSTDRAMAEPKGSQYMVNKQLHCLVYDESSISTETFEEIIDDFLDAWDLILLSGQDRLIVNKNLPISNDMAPPIDLFWAQLAAERLSDEVRMELQEWAFDKAPEFEDLIENSIRQPENLLELFADVGKSVFQEFDEVEIEGMLSDEDINEIDEKVQSEIQRRGEMDYWYIKHALITFIIFIAASLPYPQVVHTSDTFKHLLNRSTIK